MKPPTNKSISQSLLSEVAENTADDFVLDELIEEIDLIADLSIKAFVRSILVKADAFWISAAILHGQGHPPDERSEGGLVLHTQRVVRTAFLLANTIDCTQQDKDILLAAALLHDITKAVWRDGAEKTEIGHDAMHQYTLDAFVSWCTMEDIGSVAKKNSTIAIDNDILHRILRLVRCSHGVWSPIPETMPITPMEKILHISDLIALNVHAIIDGAVIKEERWLV